MTGDRMTPPPPSSSTSATSSTAGIPTASSSARSPTTRRGCASSRMSTSTAGTTRSTAAGPSPRRRPSSPRNSPNMPHLIAAWGERFGETITDPGPGRPRDRRGARRARRAALRDHQFLGRFLAALPRARERPSSRRFRDIVVSGEVKLLKPDPGHLLSRARPLRAEAGRGAVRRRPRRSTSRAR